jgi:succinyl-CoA synthetase beta subunit
MRLLEFEGKRLFARHGIAVPDGVLWPDLPVSPTGFVVKAQVPEGGRGKAGAIRFAESADAVAEAAEGLRKATVGGHRVDRVYVEERLDIARELYLAVAVDRDRRCHSLLAAAEGGVEVESLPPERIHRRPVDPLRGVTPGDLERLIAALALPATAADAAAAIVAALYALVLAEDASLAEINPLALTAAGRLIAADAKVILDGNAAFRHPEWRDLAAPGEGSTVERAISTAGSVGVEVDPEGDIVGVVSGAGLMMASLDMLVAGGGRVRLMIDLGGVVLAGPERMVPVLRTVGGLSPKVTFINAYFQTARCDGFARALAEAYARVPFAGRVIVRLKGRNDAAARAILEPLGFTILADLEPALAAVLAA